MKHMRALNKKAGRIDEFVTSRTEDVVAMQDRRCQHSGLTFPWAAH